METKVTKRRKHKGNDIQKEQTFPIRLKEDSERHSLWAKTSLKVEAKESPFSFLRTKFNWTDRFIQFKVYPYI